MNTFQFTPYVFALGLALALGLRGFTEQVSPKKEARTDFAAINEYVEAQRVRLHIPGLALGFVHGDQIVPERTPGPALAGRSVDDVLAEARSIAAAKGFTAETRLLSTPPWGTTDELVANLLAVFAGGASLVQVAHPDAGALDRRRATEKVTADL